MCLPPPARPLCLPAQCINCAGKMPIFAANGSMHCAKDIQRADGRARLGRTRTIEFPGAMAADDARSLANGAAQRANWARETLSWRIAELNPAISPGAIVRAPGIAGIWRVVGWEWREKGVELDLVRLPPAAGTPPAGDSGMTANLPDNLASKTVLRAFEVPWDGRGSSETPIMFSAASSIGTNWSGAALYHDTGGTLKTVGSTGRTRSVIGHLTAPLGPSEAIRSRRMPWSRSN